MQSYFDCRASPLLSGYNPLEGLFQLKLRSMNSMEESIKLDNQSDILNDDRYNMCQLKSISFEKQDFFLDLDEKQAREIKIFDVTKKVKKNKKKADYKKNICGYITKRIIREFLSENYLTEVKALCLKYNTSYEELRNFYLSKIQYVTGPRHLPILFTPENEHESSLKSAFREFFEWFIKERYIRYLLCDGKMNDKKAYIKFKNEVIAKYLNTKQKEEENLLKKNQSS